MKFFVIHCENVSYHIKGIGFYQLYSTVVHADSFIIKFYIAYKHRRTARILDVSNTFQNKNVTINEIFCVSTPPYYIDWFEISYHNVLLNRYDGPFCLQFMNIIQLTKPAGI